MWKKAIVTTLLLIVIQTTVSAVDFSDCLKILQNGTYEQTADIIASDNHTCVDINASDVLIDCKGHKIDGSGATWADQIGIRAYGGSIIGLKNVSIQNCVLSNWSYLSIWHPNTNDSILRNSILQGKGAIYSLAYGLCVNNSIYNNTFLSTATETSYLWLVRTGAVGKETKVYNNVFNTTYTYPIQGALENVTANTTNQSGTRRFTSGNLGGNFYTNPTATGYSDTCTDNNYDGFCDTNWSADYLPYSMNYSDDELPPRITLQQPEDNYQTENTHITFKYTPDDVGLPIAWCQLWDDVDGTWSADSNRNDTVIEDNITNQFSEKTIAVGEYTWATYCCDNKNNCNYSTNYTLTIKQASGGGGNGGGGGGKGEIIIPGINATANEINNFIFYPIWTEWYFQVESARELTLCQCENFSCKVSGTQLIFQTNITEQNILYWDISDDCVIRDIGNEYMKIPVTVNVINIGVYYPTKNLSAPVKSDLLFKTEQDTTTGVRYMGLAFIGAIIFAGWRYAI